MSVANLISDLARLEIQLEAHDDRLRYWPRSAVTPELAQRMKAHKGELLAILRHEGRDTESVYSFTDWIEHTGTEGQIILMHPDYADNNLEAIDPPDPCQKCGTLQLWESVSGDLFGQTPSKWRCTRCDPPAKAQRLRKLVARLKTNRTVSPKMNAKGGPMR